MPPLSRHVLMTCGLLLMLATCFAAPLRPPTPARSDLAMLARQVEASLTQLVGLTASGDVRTTYTALEDNLTKSPRRRFEARSAQAEATQLLWQLAVMPYPAQTGQGWQSPPGLVDCGLVPGKVTPNLKHSYSFVLDFGYYLNVVRLNLPLTSPGLYPDQLRAGGRSALLDRWAGKDKAKKVRFGWSTPGAVANRIMGQKGAAGPKMTEKVFTFYLRVVPLNAKGERVGTPSASVVLRHNAQPSDFKFATTTPATHPKVTPLSWQPERHQDPNAHYWRLIVRRPPLFTALPGVPQEIFTSVAPMQKYNPPIEVYWPPQDKSWWDKVCAAAGDFIGWVADVVNFVSNLYSSIKAFVIDSLAMIAPELRGVFSIALDIGLAAVGIPPSLPDFDELQNLGFEYVCAYVADETGIPSEITQEALKQVATQTRDARHGGGDTSMWMVPNYNKLYRPARLELQVTNPSAKSSDRVTVFCSLLAATPQGHRLVAAGNPIPLPPLAPQQSLTVPVYVQGAPEYAEQVRLYITTQMRYELNAQGVPINGKSNLTADQYNRLIRAKQVWNANQLQQAPQP